MRCSPWRNATVLATAPGARLSATIAAFSAALQRRRRGAPVKTSTRRKLCPSIGKLLGKPASLPRLRETGSSLRPQLPQDGSSVSLTLHFLDDGRIEIDSNTVERSMRPVALNRKNALFAGSDEGAE